MGRVLLIITAVSFFSNCSYWPHQWSENQIREIVRDEINNR